jgi:hypothetical protein
MVPMLQYKRNVRSSHWLAGGTTAPRGSIFNKIDGIWNGSTAIVVKHCRMKKKVKRKRKILSNLIPKTIIFLSFPTIP